MVRAFGKNAACETSPRGFGFPLSLFRHATTFSGFAGVVEIESQWTEKKREAMGVIVT
jgi:hypothetical protein